MKSQVLLSLASKIRSVKGRADGNANEPSPRPTLRSMRETRPIKGIRAEGRLERTTERENMTKKTRRWQDINKVEKYNSVRSGP